RSQVAVRDPGLQLEIGDVEHRHGRRLRAGARRGRDRQMWHQRRRRLAAFAGGGWVAIRLAILAVSMLEPPPTETKPSTPCSTANSAARCSESIVGST